MKFKFKCTGDDCGWFGNGPDKDSKGRPICPRCSELCTAEQSGEKVKQNEAIIKINDAANAKKKGKHGHEK